MMRYPPLAISPARLPAPSGQCEQICPQTCAAALPQTFVERFMGCLPRSAGLRQQPAALRPSAATRFQTPCRQGRRTPSTRPSSLPAASAPRQGRAVHGEHGATRAHARRVRRLATSSANDHCNLERPQRLRRTGGASRPGGALDMQAQAGVPDEERGGKRYRQRL